MRTAAWICAGICAIALTGEAQVREISWKNTGTVSERIPFVVYREADRERHFMPSGQIGDATDLTLIDQYPEKPKSGKQCIRIHYTGEASQSQNWAGVYWQQPDFNFGDVPGSGYNLRAASKITFWARGEKGNERVTVKAGGIRGAYPDSFDLPVSGIKLTKFWKKYTVPLVGQDLTYVIGGFYVGFTRGENPAGAIIFLDDIVYE